MADIEDSRGCARIQRIDGMRTVTVRGDLDDEVANAGEIIRDTRIHFLPELSKRFPDVEVALEGQAKESAATGGSMLRGFSLGLLPLLTEKSLQAQVLIPLATSIVFGLLASTMLVLFVVPALFSVFADLRITSEEKIRTEIGGRANGPRPAREENPLCSSTHGPTQR